MDCSFVAGALFSAAPLPASAQVALLEGSRARSENFLSAPIQGTGFGASDLTISIILFKSYSGQENAI